MSLQNDGWKNRQEDIDDERKAQGITSLQKESNFKKKKYIVRHWFMIEDVFEDLDGARRSAIELGKMEKRKDIEVIEVEISEKVL